MKIGILTFHYAYNYGAVLQCYALQEALKEMGHEVSVIDYRQYDIANAYKLFRKKKILSKNPLLLVKNICKETVLSPFKLKRKRSFEEFIKQNLNLTRRVSYDEIPDDFDVYIVGSDQIWNPKILGGKLDKAYLADFAFARDGKILIAYAASSGPGKFNEQALAQLKETAERLDAVSVREENLWKTIDPLTQKKVEIVVDPTLLVNRNVWNKFVGQRLVQEKYILVYQVVNHPETLLTAKKLSRELGVKVIEIGAITRTKIKDIFTKRLADSPAVFLNLIKHAECMVTTSFHGTAISAIFNTPFYTIDINRKNDDRCANLLELLGQRNRFITSKFNENFTPVDFTKTNKILERIKTKSTLFLEEAINGKSVN